MITAAKIHRIWRQLRLGSVNDIIGDGSALILAPHPDDESLGCGGLIAACAAAGRPPMVAIVTDGAASHPGSRAFPPGRLRARRAQEARKAVAHLGLPPGRLVFLDQPDTAAPSEGPAFEAVVDALTDLIRPEANCTAILAPWLHDPHCDHEATSRIAAAVAERCGIKAVAYPVWGWTLPADTPVPTPHGLGWRLDVGRFLGRKRAAIFAHQTQYGELITDDPDGFQLPPALLCGVRHPVRDVPSAMSGSRDASHFARLYQSNPDPWRFLSDPYEQAKYRRSIAMLGGRRFASGLEVGCSIGVLTHLLAADCDALLGVDIVEQPLEAARLRCAGQPHLRFQRMRVPGEWPEQRFDLIVLSEVLYFLSSADIALCADRVMSSVLPGGKILLVNWLGQSDDPCSGDEAAEHFITATSAAVGIEQQQRQLRYRLDLLSARG